VTDQTQKSWVRSASFGLAVLSVINLFSYLDRYIVAALIESLKHSELALTDANLGSLMSGFLVVYTLTAPVFGALGRPAFAAPLDRPRRGLLELRHRPVGIRRQLLGLLAARASVGVGEAAYVTIAPSLLSDYFPARQRGRVMAIFFCAIPVGSALGYVVGGLVDKHYGWRAAFFVAGGPGLLLAALCLLLRDPPRGAQDSETKPAAAPAPKPPHHQQRTPGRPIGGSCINKPYVLTVLGYAAYTFAVGGLAFWMPAFLERARGMPRSEATVSFGTIVVITGFIGTFVGGWLGDYCAKYSRQAYLWLSHRDLRWRRPSCGSP
jgi:MFS family permease